MDTEAATTDGDKMKKKFDHKKIFDKTVYHVTKQMAYRPVMWCSCCCAFILFVVIIAVATGAAAFSRNTSYDWVIASTQESKNNDALDDAIDQVDAVMSTGTRQEYYDESMFFFYDLKKDADLYEANNLRSMCMVESALVLNEDYHKFCRLGDDGDCILPETSIVVYFYGFTNIASWNCTLLDDAVIAAKRDAIYAGLNSAKGQEEYGLWLDKSSPSKGYTTKCNSLWSFGAPLDGYNSTSENEVEQMEKYQKFLSAIDGTVGGVEETLFEYFDFETNENNALPYYPSPYMEAASEPGLGIMFYSNLLTDNETTRVLTTDLYFAIFSIIFVLFWLRVHTNSTFIALLGMFMIFSSLPFALALYSGIYGIPFFSQLHSLVLFIVLGVGADDVFVLVDSWRATQHMFRGDITNGCNKKLVHKRLHHCYKHTMDTVFNTSFTTAMAFVATGFSPLMPIATFGWYAATCIIVNYFFVITLMPCVVVVADVYFANYIPCTRANGLPDDKGFVGQPEHGSVVDENERNSLADTNEKRSSFDKNSDRDEDELENGKGTHDVNATGYEMVDVMATSSVDGEHAVVLGSGEAKGGVMGLETIEKRSIPVDEDGDVNSDTPAMHKRELEFEPNALVEGYIKFMTGSIYLDEKKERPIPIVSISIVVGLFIFGIFGVIYGLALTPPTQQESWFPEQHMFTLAQTALTDDYLSSSENAYANLDFTFGIKGIDRSGFNIYIPDKNRGDVQFDKKWDLALPACQKVMVKMCNDIEDYPCNADGCGPSKLLARFNTTECFMRDFRTWVRNNQGVDTYAMNSNDFYGNLSAYREIGFKKYDEYSTWQNEIGFIDGKLEFGTVSLISTMESFSEMVTKEGVLDVIKKFISKVKNYEECNECSCDTLIFTSDFAFTWLRTEQGLVQGFYQGVIIAFPVAFAVLLFATGNAIISIYAIITVFFIVFGVLGFANYALDWNLGIAESIAGIIIIGFAVDYTVHLGHMYTTGENVGLTDRRAQFEFASRKIALTIVGGAITTVGAGVFMFACQLIFFQKMAALIVCTILMSYLYSLGFFMAVLYTIGPEREFGKLSAIYDGVLSFLSIEGQCKSDPPPKETIAPQKVLTEKDVNPSEEKEQISS